MTERERIHVPDFDNQRRRRIGGDCLDFRGSDDDKDFVDGHVVGSGSNRCEERL
ncbi:hypothetical protein BMAA0457 [Burkholderia mallei ATCC 23344]|uniref:Uncharacterized protein n=1 Tax=Burkholderia mallei (strain ATCC 23344) TaxID=243160 RepID=A0A0H2XD65_BURMA|nr:hypothetical protein BMAA0457 [Burkholderia mallei ATCC 23344]